MTLPFENDTGPVIKRLAARSIQTDKRRNLFVIVTIALAAALMASSKCVGKRSEMVLAVGLFIKRSLITVHVSTNLRA